MKTYTIKRTEHGYGFFSGGDPRKFHPDCESCSAAEIENHKKSCVIWDEAEGRGETPTPEDCPSGWVYDAAGKPVMHVLRAPYGIGGYEYDVEYTIPVDSSVGTWLRLTAKAERAVRNCARFPALKRPFKLHSRRKKMWWRKWKKLSRRAYLIEPV